MIFMDSLKKPPLPLLRRSAGVKIIPQYYSNLMVFCKTVKPKEVMMKALSRFLFLALLILASSFLYGEEGEADAYHKGLKDFRAGRMSLASREFRKALAANPFQDGPCLYLGILAQMEGQDSEAENWYSKGRKMRGGHFRELTFNLANLYVNQSRYEEAFPLYRALQEEDSPFRVLSLLNMANAQVNKQDYEQALVLYQEYLEEKPDAEQRPQIERMMAVLEDFLAKKKVEQEAARIAREKEEKVREAARKKEEQRFAEEARQKEEAEKRRQEEEARQKALLDEILNDLKQSGDDTENFKAESEHVEEVFEESDLDD